MVLYTKLVQQYQVMVRMYKHRQTVAIYEDPASLGAIYMQLCGVMLLLHVACDAG